MPNVTGGQDLIWINMEVFMAFIYSTQCDYSYVSLKKC